MNDKENPPGQTVVSTRCSRNQTCTCERGSCEDLIPKQPVRYLRDVIRKYQEPPAFAPVAQTGRPNPQCSMSWGGFNLHGDEKSIARAKDMLHDSEEVVPGLRQAIVDMRQRQAAPVAVDAPKIPVPDTRLKVRSGVDHATTPLPTAEKSVEELLGALASLRHVYAQLKSPNAITIPRSLADGLIAPAIESIEKYLTKL